MRLLPSLAGEGGTALLVVTPDTRMIGTWAACSSSWTGGSWSPGGDASGEEEHATVAATE